MEEIKNSLLGFFNGLTFNEEAHRYFVDGKPIQKSVSALIKEFEPEFNRDEISKRVALKRGITQEEVLAEWAATNKVALDLGNATHLFGEFYVFDRSMRPQSMHELAVVRFWEELPAHIIPVTMEIRMYHKVKLYAGTADILLYNTKTQKFIIADYKTNKDLFKNFNGQTLTGRFQNFLNNPFNKYQIQLSYYQILLEQAGIEVSGRKVVYLKPDGHYELYDCQDLTQYLR